MKIYQAKHKNNTHSFSLNRSVILLAALLLLFTVGAGATLAYIIDSTNDVTNTFTPSKVSCVVEETYDGTTKEDVQIKNTSTTGDVGAYIRAAVIMTWKDAEGSISSEKVEPGDYKITYNTTTENSDSSWVKSSDGFYYCTEPVPVGELTDVLIDSCQPIAGKAPTGYTLSVEIVAEAIQALPADAVVESWMSGVSGVSGTTLTIK